MLDDDKADDTPAPAPEQQPPAADPPAPVTPPEPEAKKDDPPAPAPTPEAKKDDPPAPEPKKDDPPAPEPKAEEKPAEEKKEEPPKPVIDGSVDAERLEQIIKAMPADVQEKARDFAKRRGSSIEEIFRNGLFGDAKISELNETMKGMVKVPGKDAKAEEIAAFDKARGVPDKAEDYKFPGEAPSDLDKAMNSAVAGLAKAAGYTQEQLDAGYAMMGKMGEIAHAEAEAAVKKFGQNASDELRLAWGVKEYQPNLNKIGRFLDTYGAQFMTKDEIASFINFRDPTTYGARGESVGMAKMLLDMANKLGDADLLGDGRENVADQGERKKEIMGWMTTDPDRYGKPEVQAELRRIISAENRRTAMGA